MDVFGVLDRLEIDDDRVLNKKIESMATDIVTVVLDDQLHLVLYSHATFSQFHD